MLMAAIQNLPPLQKLLAQGAVTVAIICFVAFVALRVWRAWRR